MAALLGVPGMVADPLAVRAPLMDGEEPPLVGDGAPLPDSVETGPSLDATWESILIARLINLTWDYVQSVSLEDNATEAQRKATQYLDAVRYEVKSVRPPNPLDLVCVDFAPNEGIEPGPGHWEVQKLVMLPVVPGKWTAKVLGQGQNCLVPP